MEIRGDMGNQMLMFSSLLVQVNQDSCSAAANAVACFIHPSTLFLLPCILDLNEFKTTVGTTEKSGLQGLSNRH